MHNNLLATTDWTDMTNISDLILNIDSLGLNTNGDFNSVQTYIKSSESDVINNIGTNFSQKEKDAILVFFSVLVRSNEYWNSDNEDVELLRKGKKWNWWRTGICDGLVAVVGAIFAGPVVGALIGGVACSAGDALAQHNDWGTNLFNIFNW